MLTLNNNINEKIMKFELVKLPYEPNALEPVISEKTIGPVSYTHLSKRPTSIRNESKNVLKSPKLA